MSNNRPYSVKELESVCGAMVRALTGDAQLQWSGQTLYQGTNVVPLLAAHQSEVSLDLDDQRALIDGAGLKLKFSDAVLHTQHAPSDPIERLVYELLEQLRVEALVPETWPGVTHNLNTRFLKWAQAFIDSGLTETSLGLLMFTIAVSTWSRLSSHEVPDDMSDIMEATRANINSEIGGYLVALRRHRFNQNAYIEQSLALAKWVSSAIQAAGSNASGSQSVNRRRAGFALPLHFESANVTPPPVVQGASSRSWESAGQRYRVFTRAYDKVVLATQLVRTAQLIEFREQIDQEVLKSGIPVQRLARIFKQRLASVKREGWRFAQEEGYLDGSRLSQLITDPNQHAIFKDEQPRLMNDCAVTILLDCSGSMKTHAQPISLMVDVMGRALDMAGIEVEILGFSTQAWNGGRAKRDWQRAGQPNLPGRLNERLHLIFKAGTVSWQQGRSGIAALRKLDLFKEGIDGEAIEWACERLMARPVRRRILMVVSDGCPMDTATNQCNDEHYLDQHLKQVLAKQQQLSQVDICALGVGLDLGWFYKRRLAIDTEATIDNATVMSIVDLLTLRH
jgi:cobaltochelatase CobT